MICLLQDLVQAQKEDRAVCARKSKGRKFSTYYILSSILVQSNLAITNFIILGKNSLYRGGGAVKIIKSSKVHQKFLKKQFLKKIFLKKFVITFMSMGCNFEVTFGGKKSVQYSTTFLPNVEYKPYNYRLPSPLSYFEDDISY